VVFSNNVVQINTLGVPLQQLIFWKTTKSAKELKNIPTGQRFLRFILMGNLFGSDILIEMYQEGELQQMVEVALAS